MPPQNLPPAKKLNPVVIVAVLCALSLLVFFVFLLPERKTVPVVPDDIITPTSATTVKVETSSSKVPVPEVFADDKTMADRKETLLALAEKSKTQKLSAEEKAYILQEFGGERSGLYKFSNEELKSIVEALNR